MRAHHLVIACLAAAIVVPGTALADDASAASNTIARAVAAAWTEAEPETLPAASPPSTGVLLAQPQGSAARTPAGPNIGTVGIGAVAGLSDLEIGPSLRLWATPRVGFQAHLGFSGDEVGPDNVNFIRFEPTILIAIGDFGEGAVNMRPYAGGGVRVARTDIGPFSDTQVRGVAVGGVELGFSRAPRFKLSVEVSVAPTIDADDFDPPRRGPRLTGGRVAALAHYFF